MRRGLIKALFFLAVLIGGSWGNMAQASLCGVSNKDTSHTDANGVDIITGYFHFDYPALSIGPSGSNGLTLTGDPVCPSSYMGEIEVQADGDIAAAYFVAISHTKDSFFSSRDRCIYPKCRERRITSRPASICRDQTGSRRPIPQDMAQA